MRYIKIIFIIYFTFTLSLNASSGITVTMEIFMGRPNPTFTIEDKETLSDIKLIVSELGLNNNIKNPNEVFSKPCYVIESPDPEIPDLRLRREGIANLDYRGVYYNDEDNVLGLYLTDVAFLKGVISGKLYERLLLQIEGGYSVEEKDSSVDPRLIPPQFIPPPPPKEKPSEN